MDHHSNSTMKDHMVIEMTEVAIAEVEEIVVEVVTVEVAEVIAEAEVIVDQGDNNHLIIIIKKKATVKAAFFYLMMISNEYPDVSTGSMVVLVSGKTLLRIMAYGAT